MQGLTAKELRGWWHYYEIEQAETIKQDWRHAALMQMLHAVNRGKKDRLIPLKDFVPKWEEAEGKKEKPRQTLEQQWAILNLLAAMHAGDPDPVPKVILTDAPSLPASPIVMHDAPDDVPGEVGPLPPGLVLPPDVQAQVDAAMKRKVQ